MQHCGAARGGRVVRLGGGGVHVGGWLLGHRLRHGAHAHRRSWLRIGLRCRVHTGQLRYVGVDARHVVGEVSCDGTVQSRQVHSIDQKIIGKVFEVVGEIWSGSIEGKQVSVSVKGGVRGGRGGVRWGRGWGDRLGTQHARSGQAERQRTVLESKVVSLNGTTGEGL